MAQENKASPEERMTRTRWIWIAIAFAVLLFGIASLVISMTRRAAEAKAAEIRKLTATIESETDELKALQKEYDTTEKTLTDLQKEYDEAREKHDAGLVETAASEEQSLDALRSSAEQAKQAYSDALTAYDASVDQVEQNAMGYDDAKATLEKLQPFLAYAADYEAYAAGTAETLPGWEPQEPADPEDPEAEAQPSDAQAWYDAVVFPAASEAGIGLPPAVEGFPTAVQALAADPTAKVETYEAALKASQEAEQKLTEANTQLETTAKAYADGKNAQRSSEDWLSDTEQEIDRLTSRIEDLEEAIDTLTEELEAHQAELKEIDQ